MQIINVVLTCVDWEPGQVQHFTIKQNDLSVPDVTLSWTAPRGLRKEDVVIYEICFIEKNASVWGKDGCGHCKVEGTSVRLSVLPQATYEFNIRALIAFIGVSNEIPGRWYSSEKFVGKLFSQTYDMRLKITVR